MNRLDPPGPVITRPCPTTLSPPSPPTIQRSQPTTRLCINYRPPHPATEPYLYPILHCEDTFDNFISSDAKSGYHRITAFPPSIQHSQPTNPSPNTDTTLSAPPDPP